MSDPGPGGERDYPADVHVLPVDGREFILVGTAHISQESADLVREVIEKERPDCVCLELDAQRFQALSQKQRFDALDLKQVIRNRQLAPLLANLLLAAYQKKLGGELGAVPGMELLAAARVAEERGIPIALCDREIRVTLRRAWASMGFTRKAALLATLLTSLFERPEIDEAELRRLREQDVLSEFMRELGEELPELKRVLIDERDQYLTQKMREASGERIVAVVGAGHVAGISRALQRPGPVDLAPIEVIPPMRPWVKWLGWGIPTVILGALAWIGLTQGLQVAGQNLLYWVIANGIPTTLGAVAALANPAVIGAAFFVAPVTSLVPVIGAGYVLAFLQAYLAPPKVAEFERVAEDVFATRRWWESRLLRIFLVFVFTTLGSMIGTWVGGAEIVSNLF